MNKALMLAPAAAVLAACATHAPQPAVYPGSTTGLVEYVNLDTKRHAVAAVRCGEVNQQTYVVLGQDQTTAKAPAGESVKLPMTIGCYTFFTGPDGMSLSGRTWRVDVRDEAEGYTQLTSEGQQSFVAAP